MFMKRTKAIEILDKARVRYELKAFAAVELSAEEVAAKLSLPLAAVYKTLVAQSDRGETVMALIPGERELSLKKLAAALGARKAQLVKVQDLQRLTGYLKGGCSPLGSKKSMPVLVDHTALSQPFISVSAGLRGLQILLAPTDLVAVAGARVDDLAE